MTMKLDFIENYKNSYIFSILAIITNLVIGEFLWFIGLGILSGTDNIFYEFLSNSKYIIIFAVVYSMAFSTLIKYTNFLNNISLMNRIIITILIIVAGTSVHTIIFKVYQAWFVNEASDFFSDVIFRALIGSFPIVIGLLFIKPWKRLLNYCVGIIYIPLASLAQLYIELMIAGVIFDDWL